MHFLLFINAVCADVCAYPITHPTYFLVSSDPSTTLHNDILFHLPLQSPYASRPSIPLLPSHTCAGPPSAPRAVAVSEIGAFTANLTWTAPEDDGGVSDPSWDSALDSRENRPYLTYSVTLANRTITTMATTQSLSLPLSTLQHSTAYTATVEAGNVYGRGPQGTTPFTTTDSGERCASVVCLTCVTCLPTGLNGCLEHS